MGWLGVGMSKQNSFKIAAAKHVNKILSTKKYFQNNPYALTWRGYEQKKIVLKIAAAKNVNQMMLP